MSAANAVRPKQPASVHNLSDGQLADEHRNLDLGIHRYKQRQKMIEDELTRRGLASAEGERAIVSQQFGDIGLLDIKRVRAELGDGICREYRIPGSERFWRSIDKAK